MSAAGEHQRIAGLDLWRAVLMLAGLLLHGSIWLGPHPVFGLIDIVSQSFRMGVFFAVSGFLGARALARRGPRRWLRERAVQLGVPALFGISVISPLMWLVTVAHAEAGQPAPLLFEWHHLWFLYGLLLYSGIVAAGYRSARLRRWCGSVRARLVGSDRHMRPALLLMTLASASLLAGMAATMQSVLPHVYAAAFNKAELIAAYLPMFLLGCALASSAALRDRVLAVRGVSVVLVTLLVACVVAVVSPAYLPNAWAVAINAKVRFVGATLGPPFAFVAVLRSALSITHVGAMTRRWSDASYTIYLLHVPMLSIGNALLVRTPLHPLAIYAVSVTGAGITCYLLHVHVVRRVAALALLLNGRVALPPAPLRVAVAE